MTAFNNADAYWIDGRPVDRIIYDGQIIWENDVYGIVEGGEVRIGPLPEQKGYFKTHIFTELEGAQSFVVNQDIDEAWILVVGSGGPTGESATTVPGAGGGGRMFTYSGPITADTFYLAVHPREELSDNANGTGTDLISTLNGIDWNAQAGGSGGDYDTVGSAGGSGGGGSFGTATRSGGGNSSVGDNGTTPPTTNLGNSGQAASSSTDFGRGRGGGAKFSGSGGGQGVFNPWRTGEWVEYASGSVLNPAPDTGNGGYTEVEGEAKTGEGGIVMLTYRYTGEGPSRKWYKGSQGDTTASQQLIFCDRDPANGAPFFVMAASSGKIYVSYNGVSWVVAWTAESTSTISGIHFDRELDKLYAMQSTTHYELSADFLTSTPNTPTLTSLKRMATDTTNGIRMVVGSSGKIAKNTVSPTVFWDWNTAEQLTIVDSVSLEEWGSTTINDVKTDNNGMWVIVGSSTKMAVSKDSGLTWRIYKEADHGADMLTQFIGYNGNTWVFGSSHGTYIHTKDFETWTRGVVESIAHEELAVGEISWQEPHQKWFINANSMKSPWTGCFFESSDLVNWESSNTYSSLFPKTIVSGMNRTVASRLSGEMWNTRINQNVTLFRSSQPLGKSQLPTLDSSPALILLDTNETTYWDYETDMNWNNSAGKDLSWLLDVTRFKDNKIDTGRYAFYRSPAVSFTALPDLDTSNITDMYAMFQQCPNFNQSLDNFDTSNVTGMRYMFDAASSFNQPVNHFDVGNVIEMQQMFRGASDFNQDLDNWRPVNAQFIHWMFINCSSFNGSIEGWEIPNVTSMYGMFQGCASFNHPSVSNLTIPEGVSNLKNMFYGANLFNQDISSWSLANVEILEFMFRDALMFDKPLENWNVSAATNMRGMFQNAISFKQDISQWLTQRVENMSDMFNGASAFSSNLNPWDTSKVTNMSGMFKGASAFASKLTWNTFLVTNMDSMFMDALSFNSDLSAWCVPSITTAPVDFNTGAVAWTLPKPVWGTCPGGPGNIFAFAGDGSTSVPSDGTLATSAGLNSPRGVAFDGTNNAVYISSANHHRVYKVDLATEQVTTFAGNGIASNDGDGGAATSASLNQPWGLLCHDNKLYIACSGGHVVRVVDLSTNVISRFAGTGTGSHSGDGDVATSAMLQNPVGLAYGDGKIYIADMSNHRVRSVDLSNNIIATLAGTGTASNGGDGGQAWAATLNSPRGVAYVDGKVYIADANNHKIRSVDLSSNIISTFVGTGTAGSTGDGGAASNATLNSPWDVVGGGDGYLYITDTNGHKVRKVDLVSEIIDTYAGTGVGSSSGDDGPATSAQLNLPTALAVGDVYLYIVETTGNRVRKINFEAL